VIGRCELKTLKASTLALIVLSLVNRKLNDTRASSDVTHGRRPPLPRSRMYACPGP